MHTSEKCRRGKQQISHRESERERARERDREREREREERGRERRLRINHIQHTFFVVLCEHEAIADEDEKEDKRQHKYDASQK